ncbi:MAG TPA: DinB family protein, partial [Deinococcales bacterium]|nr:DinB family protein [Deinococcales bacterium]
VGHLADSGLNTLGRVVRAAGSGESAFVSWEQDDWMALQGWTEARWEDVLDLFEGLNRQLARVLDRLPAEAWSRRLTVGDNAPVTLEAQMAGHVRHLRHHLAQVGALPGE